MLRKKSSGSYYGTSKENSSKPGKESKTSRSAFSRRRSSASRHGLKDIFYFFWFHITSLSGVTIGIFAGIIIGGIIIFSTMLYKDFKAVQALTDFKPNVTTKIYDKNGIMIAELFRQKREIVPFEKIPNNLVKAFVAMEDNEFYDHFGVNPKGIVRAFFVNVLAGGIRQGGSTITQQLSKILLTSRKRTIWRKIKEAFIAIMMDATYSKNEILALYLNQIFLGHGTYGVEAASKFYFDKPVHTLNLAECALIATLPSAPNRLSPIKHPKTAMRMHRRALARMAELGYVSIEEAEKAYLDFWPEYLAYINELPPTRNTWSSRVNKTPWFTEYIRRKLVKKYGEEIVYEKGLYVYTTLDLKKQLAAQEVMNKHLKKQTAVSGQLSFKNEDIIIEKYADVVQMFGLVFDIDPFAKKGSYQDRKINDYFQEEVLDQLEILNFAAGLNPIGKLCTEYKSRYLQDKDFQKVEGALISINQTNGYIEAMVGGSEFSSHNQLNRTIQAFRQPGSSIKPLLYSAAIETKKFTAATAVLDSPMVYLDNEGGDWIPENYEGEYFGLVRLRRALQKSINVISIRIAETIGIDTVLNYYQKMLRMNDAEADRRLRRDFSIALGSIEVSPYELARAYAIIANGGKDVVPLSIRYIKNNKGEIIENEEEDIKKLLAEKRKKGVIQILTPATAQVMISMMRSVVTGGTGILSKPGRPAGGKTGTTNNWKDAWFVGYTPEITTCLWIGYDSLGMSLGRGQTGGMVAAPIWGEYIRKALASDPVRNFPVFANLQSVDVCARSGLLPSDKCQSTVTEVFIPGTVPEEKCESCVNSKYVIDASVKTPDDSLIENQKTEMYKEIDDLDDDSDVLDSIGGDLLE